MEKSSRKSELYHFEEHITIVFKGQSAIDHHHQGIFHSTCTGRDKRTMGQREKTFGEREKANE